MKWPVEKIIFGSCFQYNGEYYLSIDTFLKHTPNKTSAIRLDRNFNKPILETFNFGTMVLPIKRVGICELLDFLYQNKSELPVVKP